jgi:uncharacterized sulfatase
MGGYHRNTTPNLQRIADSDGGQYFSNCLAAGNATALSAASILTGTYPSHHGLKSTNESIPEQLDTVSERFRDAGYATAGLSRNSYVSSGTGLHRGFEKFEWLAASTFLDVLNPATITKYFLNIRRHSAGFTHVTAKHATPYLMNEVAKNWFTDLEADQPFFFYLHYNEPHRPYYPPLPYLDKYTDDLDVSTEEAADIAMRVHYEMEEIVADDYDLSETEQRAIEAMYDAEITYTDEMIGRLFDYVQSMGLDDTVVIITADHGELFGERGMLAHRIVLNDAVTHVPLVIHGLDDVDYPSDGLVQHLDLIRSLAAMGGAATDGLQGIDMREVVREHAISQRQGANFEPYLNHNPDFDTSQFHDQMLTSFRTPEFRYERSDERSRLFKLPDETADVSDEYPDIRDRLDDELSEWLTTEGEPIATGEDSQLTDEMQKQLQNLGYLE